MNYTIKILESNDVSDFRNIRLSALKTSPEMFGSSYESEVEKPLDFFQNCLVNSVVFGAYSDKKIIGIATLTKETISKLSHKAYLSSVFVIPKFQNQGVAKKLLNTVIEHSKPNIEQIVLTVASDNSPAINLYKKFNFQIYGEELKALKNGDKYIDELMMKLFIR